MVAKEKSRTKEIKKYEQAYKELSELTGIELSQICEHSYCVVMDPDDKLAGKVGAYIDTWNQVHYFKFKEKRKWVGIEDSKTRGKNPKIFLTRDPLQALEQRAIAVELAEEIPLLRKKI